MQSEDVFSKFEKIRNMIKNSSKAQKNEPIP